MNRFFVTKTVMMCLLLVLAGGFLWVDQGYCQDQSTIQLLGQVARVYTGGDGPAGDGLIFGFSMWGLMGGFLFAGIGFIAFMYGKKNGEFRPLIIGVLLMGYPYFLKGTAVLYLVGILLTVVLFVWRE